MRRRHADHVRVGWQLFHDHSFTIDRHGRDPRTGGRRAPRAVRGNRGFVRPRYGGSDQDPGEQIEGLLQTR
jgi:hypothetical protein